MPITADDQAKLSAPFDSDEIELKPQPLRKEAEKGKCDRPDPNGVMCGGYHGLPAVHLPYVGHAGVTMRLLSVDPNWTWEPLAVDENGLPRIAEYGRSRGLWIKLTVLGVTRLGFGDATNQSDGSAIKEIIGDAIRNAAMRFGVGTHLWSKSEKARAELVRQGQDDPEAPASQPAAAQEGRSGTRRGQGSRKAQGEAQRPAEGGPSPDSPTEAGATARALVDTLPEDDKAHLRNWWAAEGLPTWYALDDDQAEKVAGEIMRLQSLRVTPEQGEANVREAFPGAVEIDPVTGQPVDTTTGEIVKDAAS